MVLYNTVVSIGALKLARLLRKTCLRPCARARDSRRRHARRVAARGGASLGVTLLAYKGAHSDSVLRCLVVSAMVRRTVEVRGDAMFAAAGPAAALASFAYRPAPVAVPAWQPRNLAAGKPSLHRAPLPWAVAPRRIIDVHAVRRRR